MQVDITDVALVSAMDQVKECILDISAVWASEATSHQELLSALSSHAVGRDLNSAIYWLFLRLGMANPAT
jgi:replication-associated recombination protein RarA